MNEKQVRSALQGCGIIMIPLWVFVISIIWLIFDTRNRDMAIGFVTGFIAKAIIDSTVTIISRWTAFDSDCPKCEEVVFKTDNYCSDCGEKLHHSED